MRIIKRIEYNSRTINFTASVVFSSMGKYVTDFLSRFHSDGFVITPLTEEEYSIDNGISAHQELQCVIEALDSKNIPTEMAPGIPFTVHGRVLEALKDSIPNIQGRRLIIKALQDMDDEAFSWFVLAIPPSAMLHGGTCQIWPDGLGGFKDRKNIELLREAAQEYIKNAT